MKVEDTFSIQCVTGANKNLGNGLDPWLTLGGQLEIFQITGNHLLIY